MQLHELSNQALADRCRAVEQTITREHMSGKLSLATSNAVNELAEIVAVFAGRLDAVEIVAQDAKTPAERNG